MMSTLRLNNSDHELDNGRPIAQDDEPDRDSIANWLGAALPWLEMAATIYIGYRLWHMTWLGGWVGWIGWFVLMVIAVAIIRETSGLIAFLVLVCLKVVKR